MQRMSTFGISINSLVIMSSNQVIVGIVGYFYAQEIFIYLGTVNRFTQLCDEAEPLPPVNNRAMLARQLWSPNSL